MQKTSKTKTAGALRHRRPPEEVAADVEEHKRRVAEWEDIKATIAFESPELGKKLEEKRKIVAELGPPPQGR